jgi:CHAT domain-containing protein/tetratricopeptide (TPR) repeat protein
MNQSIIFYLFALPMSLLASEAFENERPEVVSLRPGIALTESLSGGQEKRYQIVVPVAGSWRFSVDQLGIDIELDVKDSNGSNVVVDGLTYRYGSDSHVESVDGASRFDIVVRSTENAVSPGRYTIVVEHLPETTEQDRRRIKAEKATAVANRHIRMATPESFELAEKYYLEALAIWRALDAPAELANALHRAGAIMHETGHGQVALAHLQEALTLYRNIGNQIVESEISNDIGLIHLYRGEYKEAELAFEAALQSISVNNDPYSSATIQNNLCLLMHYRGNLYEALDCYTKVLEDFVKIGELQRIALLHNNLGRAYDIVGEPAQARFHLEKAIALRQQVDDRGGKALSLNNLALLERRVGNFQGAISKYLKALEIQNEIGDKHAKAMTLHNLGTAYFHIGDADVALGFLLNALEIRREVSDTRGQGSTLTSLAYTYREIGQPGRAKALLEEAASLRLSIGDKSGEGRAYLELGITQMESGDVTSAANYIDRAIDLFQSAGDQHRLAAAWLEKGKNLAHQNKHELARASLGNSLDISKKTNNSFGKAKALLQLAMLSNQQHKFTSALAFLDRSIENFESIRGRIESLGMRASFASKKQKADAMRVELLMSLHDKDQMSGYSEAALLANEWRLARSLVDLIRESDVDLYADIDSELRNRRHELMETTGAKAAYLTAISDAASDNVAAIRATRELDTAITELEVLEAQIRAKDPRISRLKQSQHPTLSAVQHLLDPDSVLLHYYLGETRSFLWMVTLTSVESYVLPPRDEIEALARTVYEEFSHLTIGTSCSGQREIFELSELLLGPVRQRLNDKRLVIVPDGVLSYIAFSALPDPNAKHETFEDCYSPLLENHEVVYLPSATVLSAQRKTYAKRPQTRPAIAVFADPVYSANDIRLKGVDTHSVDLASKPGALVNVENDIQFLSSVPERLVATRREAAAIASTTSRWNIDTFLGFNANKKTFVTQPINGYRVVHLATHGILDSQRPRLSSLLLSQYSAEGQPRDGYLRLQDIYGLKLNSDLVVLSGCETALGKKIRGEGFVGLTRGFMYAGAKAVIASLWRVEDAATAELMRHFYDAMIHNNMHSAAALRYAKLKIADDHRWQKPYYWAAFVIQGDWR